MTLADLIDLELQLARDRDADPDALAARDRALVHAEPEDARPGRRAALLARWLGALRAAAPAEHGAGARVARGLALLRLLLAVIGLALGFGTASALLAYDGGHPVNVWDLLLVLVGVQLVLLVLLAASLAGGLRRLGAPFVGPLAAPLRALLAAALPALAGGHALRAAWGRLRSRRSLYHALEPWLLLSLTQVLGAAFNAGALLGCLRRIVFSDVAFGWSTTLLELDPRRFHALVHALAWPWRALWPAADPSLALVEATRYSRLEGAYLEAGAGRAADPSLVGGWWPFLVAALVVYGLLPRLVALAAARLRAGALLRALPLDDAEVERVVRRLTEPRVTTGAAAPEPPLPAPGPLAAEGPPPEAGGRCALVVWRDAPAGEPLLRLVAARTHRPVAAVATAGGVAEEAAPPDWAAALGPAEPVVVAAEAFEAPDRAALRLLRDLRAALGPRRHLIVLLLDAVRGVPTPPSAGDLLTWREGVARLADPYLAVEPVGAAP